MIGDVHGKLTILEIYKNKKHIKRALCACECGNEKDINYYDMLSGKIVSCGCHKRDMAKNQVNTKNRIGNNYIASQDGDTIFGDLRNSKEIFLTDAIYFDKIKKYTWRMNTSGYIVTTISGKEISLHRFICDFPSEEIDHRDRNKLNNKKENLRIATTRQNSINKGVRTNNSSGVVGVNYSDGGWVARISDKKYGRIFLGKFIEKKDAIIARLVAEKFYYGEFAPQQNLFEEYGV